jgi:hypothetical protein
MMRLRRKVLGPRRVVTFHLGRSGSPPSRPALFYGCRTTRRRNPGFPCAFPDMQWRDPRCMVRLWREFARPLPRCITLSPLGRPTHGRPFSLLLVRPWDRGGRGDGAVLAHAGRRVQAGGAPRRPNAPGGAIAQLAGSGSPEPPRPFHGCISCARRNPASGQKFEACKCGDYRLRHSVARPNSDLWTQRCALLVVKGAVWVT